ncbi:MAG TPA: hypothetical protein VEA37_02895, partial [Flavobacterium sp.]|nr:hypothetical protein [Flavobacterium sp.]
NGCFKEALDIIHRLLKRPHELKSNLMNVLQNALDINRQLDKMEECKLLLKTFILYYEVHFIGKLNLLSWSLTNLQMTEDEVAEYATVIQIIAEELGVVLTTGSAIENIKLLKDVNKSANSTYTQIQLSFKGKSKDERRILLHQYLESNPPLFYRELAKQALA